MKKFMICIYAVLFLLVSIPSVQATSETDTAAATTEAPAASDNYGSESVLLMDAETGTILYEKQGEKKQYPASITKIMTTLLVLENCTLDEMVTFSNNAIWSIDRASSNVGMQEDEEMSVRDCLYALMLESANEVAVALGEHVSGDIDTFIALMNNRAEELGCTNTNFMNPNGLHDDNHYTTAHDMALITREALKSDVFLEICGASSYEAEPTNLGHERTFWQHNKLIKYADHDTYRCEGIQGGKTGYTSMAGNTLVSFAERDGHQLICVTLKGSAGTYYSDTISLFEYGFNEYDWSQIPPLSGEAVTDDIEEAASMDVVGVNATEVKHSPLKTVFTVLLIFLLIAVVVMSLFKRYLRYVERERRRLKMFK
ncbi:MAG: D-alanyl-D-alanine carboxypeptidase family protein [Lachnospiraceae bacterium]